MWVNNVDLFRIGNGKTAEIKDLIVEDDIISSFTEKFDRIKYNKLLSEFEQITANKWCNRRKLVQNLKETTNEDDKMNSINLDEKKTSNRENGENEMKFYQELLSEVIDDLFYEYCADSNHIQINIHSDSTLLKLKYLAHRGCKEYLGILQIWIIYFNKLLQNMDPSTSHRCEERIFSGNYIHHCCLQLLQFHYNQMEIRKSNQKIDGNVTQFKATKSLKKRMEKLSEYNNELSIDSSCDDTNIPKFVRFNSFRAMDIDFVIPQPKKSIEISRKTEYNVFLEERQHNQYVNYIANRTRSSTSWDYYFLPVNNEWRILKCKML